MMSSISEARTSCPSFVPSDGKCECARSGEGGPGVRRLSGAGGPHDASVGGESGGDEPGAEGRAGSHEE